MAGSPRSPVLREEWGARDAKVPENRERHRGRGSRRDRGRGRYSERGRYPPRGHGRGPSCSFPNGRRESYHRDHSPGPSMPRPSPGPRSEFREDKTNDPRASLAGYHQNLERHNPLPGAGPVDHRSDRSPPGPPPPKRKRTRSPSTRRDHRNHHRGHEDGLDRRFPHRGRGRFPGRGRSGRRSPTGGRGRRGGESDRFYKHPRRPRSPYRGGKPYSSPRYSPRSPLPEDLPESDYRYRSPSVRSPSWGSTPFSRRNSGGDLGMNTIRPSQQIVDERPSRPIPSYDPDGPNGRDSEETSTREAFRPNGMRASESGGNHRSRPHRPHIDSQQFSASPQYGTPTSSYRDSPQPTSPYPTGRGGNPYRGHHG